MATSSYSQANLCIFQSSLLKEFFTISIINVYNESRLFSLTILYNSGPQTFQHQVPILWEIIFLQTGVGDGLGMIQVHYIYCALYFYYYYISSTSDHQALDPRGREPLLQNRNKISQISCFWQAQNGNGIPSANSRVVLYAKPRPLTQNFLFLEIDLDIFF